MGKDLFPSTLAGRIFSRDAAIQSLPISFSRPFRPRHLPLQLYGLRSLNPMSFTRLAACIRGGHHALRATLTLIIAARSVSARGMSTYTLLPHPIPTTKAERKGTRRRKPETGTSHERHSFRQPRLPQRPSHARGVPITKGEQLDHSRASHGQLASQASLEAPCRIGPGGITSHEHHASSPTRTPDNNRVQTPDASPDIRSFNSFIIGHTDNPSAETHPILPPIQTT